MVAYNKGEFIDEEPDRRSRRDEMRDKFFSELGGERLKEPFSLEPEPGAQLALVGKLIEEAISLHQDEKSALASIKSHISASQLSISTVGTSPIGRPTLSDMKLSAWGEFFNLKND